MYAVGIDVSKGKSTVAILRPFGEVVASPFDVYHSPKELQALVTRLKSLDGNTKVVMEYTGNYYLPIARFLSNNGLFVSVVNPILLKNYSSKSLTVRKVKNEKKDALKLANFAFDNWVELSPFSGTTEMRLQLKALNRQYNKCNKIKIMLKNNLISILDQTFPEVNSLFTSPVRKADGREKWVDFVLKYYHAECVSGRSLAAFSKSYRSWCEKNGYNYSDKKARQIYAFACNCVPTLPFSEGTKLIVTCAATQVHDMDATLASLIAQMHFIAKTLPEYNVVMAMYGVGYILGPQLIAEIGDISRFKKKQSLAAFAGVDPEQKQSGKDDPKSRPITKRGSPHLRKTLFQIMCVILQNANADEPVFRFLDKKRKQGKLYRTYMTAGANKFLRIYYARVTEYLKSLQQAA